MPQTIKASTVGGRSAILGSPFWSEGKTVTGKYVRDWESSVGLVREFLANPRVEATVDKTTRKVTEAGDANGETVQLEKFSMGGLKGWEICLGDLESQGIKLLKGDKVTIKCVGFDDAQNGKDAMANFEIEITR